MIDALHRHLTDALRRHLIDALGRHGRPASVTDALRRNLPVLPHVERQGESLMLNGMK